MKEQVGTKLRGIQIAVSEHLVLGASLGPITPGKLKMPGANLPKPELPPLPRARSGVRATSVPPDAWLE